MLLRIGFKNFSAFQICGLFASCGLSPKELCRQVTSWCLPSRQDHFGNQGTCDRPCWGWGNASNFPAVFFCPQSKDRAGRQNGWTCSGIVLWPTLKVNTTWTAWVCPSLGWWVEEEQLADHQQPWSWMLSVTPRRNRTLPGCRQSSPGQVRGALGQLPSPNSPGLMVREKWKNWASMYEASPEPFSRTPNTESGTVFLYIWQLPVDVH